MVGLSWPTVALGHVPLNVPMQDSSSWPPLPHRFLPSPSPSRELSDLSLSLPAGAPQEALPDVTPTTTTSFPSRQPLAPQPSLLAPARPAPRYLPQTPLPLLSFQPTLFILSKGLSQMQRLFPHRVNPWLQGHRVGGESWSFPSPLPQPYPDVPNACRV